MRAADEEDKAAEGSGGKPAVTDASTAVDVPPRSAKPTNADKKRAVREVPAPPEKSKDGTPLLKRSGILVTRSVIDLHGRSYSIPQLNSIKIDPANHPMKAWLSLLFLASMFIGGILMLSAIFDNKNNGTMFFFSLVFLSPAVYALVVAHRLPAWALLRFEMSSGKVKALTAERGEVEEVASAIRAAMDAR